MHALFWIPHDYIDAKSYIDTINQKKKEIATRVIDAALGIVKPLGARISTLVKEGLPEQCIVDAAAAADVDLIAMGARGIKGIESLFIGSVTNAVALDASRPVLISKPPGCSKLRNLRILFATDGSAHSLAAANFLSEMPFSANTDMTVVNVIWPAMSDILLKHIPLIGEKFREVAERGRAAERENSERIIEEAREHLKRRFDGIHVLSADGDPSKEILRISEAMQTDIIVVGCRGLSGIQRAMGSVSRNILTHSRTSVLIGRTSLCSSPEPKND